MDNVDFEFSSNGEERVMDCVASIGPECVFDVGANKGDWTTEVQRRAQDCQIHAFEIVPQVYEDLKTVVGDRHQNVWLNQVGLSDHLGEIEVYFNPERSCLSSAFPVGDLAKHSQPVSCRVVRGDQYMGEKGIEKIDFLKVDVEGMELMVLKGFGEQLRKVRCIQFEYGIFNIASRILLLDFFDYLKRFDLVIGKIYPDHVEFLDYHFTRENFMGNNYLAIHKDDVELRRLLENE